MSHCITRHHTVSHGIALCHTVAHCYHTASRYITLTLFPPQFSTSNQHRQYRTDPSRPRTCTLCSSTPNSRACRWRAPSSTYVWILRLSNPASSSKCISDHYGKRLKYSLPCPEGRLSSNMAVCDYCISSMADCVLHIFHGSV